MDSNTEIMIGLGAEVIPLPEARLTLVASRENGWRLKGTCELHPGLKLTDLLKKLNVEGGPDLELSVTRLGLEYVSSEDYRCFLTTAFGATGKPATLVIRAERRNGSFGLGGTLDLGGLVFDVSFDGASKASSPSLVATLGASKGSGGSVSLRQMLAPFTSDTGWAPDVSMALKHGLFAYYPAKAGPEPRGSRFLFSLKLDMEASLTISALPLIGQELKASGSEMRFQDLELLVASSPLDAAAVAQLNTLLQPTKSSLPASAIEAGFQLTAKLTVGGSALALPPLRLGGAPAAEKASAAPRLGATPQQPVAAAAAAEAPAKKGYQLGPLFLTKITPAFDSASASIKVQLTGGVRFSSFELELMDAGVSIPFSKPSDFKPFLGGVALSVKAGAVSVAGAFMEQGTGGKKYGGLLRVDLTTLTLTAMGLYEEISLPEQGRATSLFIYGCLNTVGGSGIPLGPLKLTGLALAFGLNRRVKLPSIEKVADFPLVKMAMAERATAIEPGEALKQLEQYLPVEVGQNFGCLGVRFTIATTVDCFALGIVQFGNDLEIALLGLARYARKDVCFLELSLKVLLRPSEGLFLAQGQLTGESWVLDKGCRLTGGFAIGFWFDGASKGDFVMSLGGYHPRFKKPDHYPVVPRLGFTWKVTPELSMKGELYCALTPSALMAGGRLEADYRSSPISARFVAYLDLLMEWAPLHYELDVGASLEVRVETWLKTFEFSLGVAVSLWGPPFGGRVDVNLSVISFSITFGAGREPPRPIATWAQFAAQFVDKGTENVVSTAGRPGWELPGKTRSELGPALFQFNLRQGALLRAPRARPPGQAATAGSDGREGSWYVRGDELELGASTVIPVTRLEVGQMDAQSTRDNLPDLALSGRNLVLNAPVRLKDKGTAPYEGTPVGIRPMAVRSLDSTLRVTVIPEGMNQDGLDLSTWSFDIERTGMPGALWDTEPASFPLKPEPEVKVIQGCIVGLTRLRPPAGKRQGQGLPIAGLLPPVEGDSLSTPRLTAAPGVSPGSLAAVSASAGQGTQRRAQTAGALEALGFKFPGARP